MKTKFFALALATGLLLNSCTSSDMSTPITPPATGEISGVFTENKTFALGNYTLRGIVKVKTGVTVTFEAGSTITANKSTGDNALVVLNGGKLIINGTADKPVVFTEASKNPGSWGGIIMYGDAPIKAVGGVATSTSEDGNALPYGGTNATHNGGSLSYVRVEYAGAKLADGTKENNAFTFYSVGSGTTLDHLVAYRGADDGYEFFGGTVSATNLVAYGNTDDSFDWQDGWQGQNNSNWYAYQVGKANYGMEIESSNVNNAFSPKVTNITLKRAAGTTPEAAGAIEIDAFQFKKEGNGDFDNIIIDGYGDYTEGTTTYRGAAVKIQDVTTNNNQVNASKIKITNAKITNTSQTTPVGATPSGATTPIVVSFPANTFTTSSTATGANLTTGAWSTVGDENLIK